MDIFPDNTSSTSSASSSVDTSLVWLSAKANPAVLAQLFKLQLPQIYAMRKNGQLPVNPDATYAESLSTYISYLSKRAQSKNVDGQEELVAAQVSNLKSRTHKNWLDIAAQRGELLDVDKVGLMLEAAFIRMRDTVVNLGRKYPEAEDELLLAFSDLAAYGNQVATQNAKQLDDMLAKEVGE